MNKAKIFILIAAIAVVFSLVFIMGSCTRAERYEYYSQKENYINVTATVTSIKYDPDATALYIGFENISPILDDSCFKIVGQNLLLVQKNGIEDELKPGDHVTFTTAPMYFGDGYVMPIVALYAHGKTFLEFEDGYDNLLIWLSN